MSRTPFLLRVELDPGADDFEIGSAIGLIQGVRSVDLMSRKEVRQESLADTATSFKAIERLARDCNHDLFKAHALVTQLEKELGIRVTEDPAPDDDEEHED